MAPGRDDLPKKSPAVVRRVVGEISGWLAWQVADLGSSATTGDGICRHRAARLHYRGRRR